MCSISWTRQNAGWVVYFSRDEQRLRPPAKPPTARMSLSGKRRILAPLDPQSGGTWLLANDTGFLCALLNTYKEEDDRSRFPQPTKSRGQVLAELGDCMCLTHLETALAKAIGDAVVAPFCLFGFRAAASPLMYLWDGRKLNQQALPVLPFYSTSSVRTREIVAHRRRRFQASFRDPWQPAAEELLRFHQHHDTEDPAGSVCMSREDARTVSLSRVLLQPDGCLMQYRRVEGDPPVFEPPVSAHLNFGTTSTAPRTHFDPCTN